jgi:hypothetical protein
MKGFIKILRSGFFRFFSYTVKMMLQHYIMGLMINSGFIISLLKEKIDTLISHNVNIGKMMRVPAAREVGKN